MTPDKHTNQEFHLDVGDGHRIYVHDWGNPDAEVPIMVLHGGPGNGCDDKDKRYFDPDRQRVIFHDQRGAGRSLPAGQLRHNTTDKLVGDIQKIADKLSLKSFVMTGGSWGSTLALAYAIEHPERVRGLVVNGVFTGTQSEIDWVDKGGWREFFPDVWQDYAGGVPARYRDDPSQYHYKQALSDDTEAARQSTYAYLKMELAILKLDDRYEPEPYHKFEAGGARIELHYLANQCFMADDHILKNAVKLTMPVKIIAGRYDMVTPPAIAYRLHQALPDSQLIWTINGHMRQHEARNIQNLLIRQLSGPET